MSDTKNEVADVEIKGALTVTQEIDNLKGVHAYLSDFAVAGKFAPEWSRLLDAVGLVANSLIVKEDARVKALAGTKVAESLPTPAVPEASAETVQ